MCLKLKDFDRWYKSLTRIEKEIFNNVISDMRDEFFNKNSDNNAEEKTL